MFKSKGNRGYGLFKGRLMNRVGVLAAAGLLALAPLTEAHAVETSAPSVPTGQGIVRGGGVGCATEESAPDTVGSPRPQLTARVHDEADVSPSPNLRADFTIDSRNPDGSWTRVADSLVPSTGFVSDDTRVTTALSTTLAPATVYRMSAATWAYATDQAQYAASATTAFCYFTVDPTAPLAPKISYGGPYSECTANSCVAAGGAGVTGTFSFAPGDGDSPVVGYRFRFRTDSTWTYVTGSSVTITFAPPYRTFEDLQVAARDTLGRYGPDTITSFMVA
ncbi:hypothetical protein ADL35_21185 [Streptomyces sp. NRRL WC-3753]|nr:hypothetical protein ADL35_21185 [Streptomyces sp. NRRL WC-3753]